MKEVHQRSYICASVVYELLALPKVVSHYHCSQCRKGDGAAFASYGTVPRSTVQIVRGASIKTYASCETIVREFCAQCGLTLFRSRSQGEFATGFQ